MNTSILRNAAAEIMRNWKYIAATTTTGVGAAYLRAGAEAGFEVGLLFAGTQVLGYGLREMIARGGHTPTP